jgi:amidase
MSFQRVPAAHGGLYGLKPSNHRLPHAGLCGSHDGMEAIMGSLGPLARSARDLSLFCQVMSDYEPWLVEPQLVEIPWRQYLVDGVNLPEKLVVGILKDDGVVLPHPPILDALNNVERALITAGHEVVEWEPMDQKYSWDFITKLYFPDGGKEYIDTMRDGNDPMNQQTSWILSHAPKALTLPETWKMNSEREAFRTRLAKRWNETRTRTRSGRAIDIILCPVAPTLAPPHETTKYWGYTSFWNLADYPGVVFPMGHFRSGGNAEVAAERLPPARNGIEEFVRSQWDPKTYENAPMSLQIVGRRLNEEKVLRALNVIEGAIRAQSAP